MIVDISVSDILKFQEDITRTNEVTITHRDISNIPGLMEYFEQNGIFLENELALSSLSLDRQNMIGVYFAQSYGYIREIENVRYILVQPLRKIFHQNEVILDILNKNINRVVNLNKKYPIDNVFSLSDISTSNLNLLLLNIFSIHNRNFKESDKYIHSSETLTDINMIDYSKESDIAHFIITQFTRYISIQRGSIPFSSNFGSILKTTIQSKLTDTTKRIILEDIVAFFEYISLLYADITLHDITYNIVEEVVSNRVEVTIYISINGEEIDVNIIK
jgi:hypothetical protein